jgi:S1-C subfamily serine protease
MRPVIVVAIATVFSSAISAHAMVDMAMIMCAERTLPAAEEAIRMSGEDPHATYHRRTTAAQAAKEMDARRREVREPGQTLVEQCADPLRAPGSGFAVAPGRVVTSYHVVEDARRIVTLGGVEFVLGGDIIVAVGGDAIRGPDELMDRLLRAHPGDRLPLTVVNADGRREVTLVVPVMHH